MKIDLVQFTFADGTPARVDLGPVIGVLEVYRAVRLKNEMWGHKDIVGCGAVLVCPFIFEAKPKGGTRRFYLVHCVYAKSPQALKKQKKANRKQFDQVWLRFVCRTHAVVCWATQRAPHL